jgi:hypothetical protein
MNGMSRFDNEPKAYEEAQMSIGTIDATDSITKLDRNAYKLLAIVEKPPSRGSCALSVSQLT